MKIAVISDLHIGTTARGADFSTTPTEDNVIPCFMESFKNYFHDPCYHCDALIVAGDITNRANDDEFELAATRIKEIADTLKVNHDSIYFTPGNHDSNWELNKAKKQSGVKDPEKLRSARYELFNDNEFIKNRMSESTFGSFVVSPYFVLWESDKLIVLSYNSSANDDEECGTHHGEIKPEDLVKIKNELEKYKRNFEGKVKVLVCHHHPINYVEKTFYAPDFSIMANAQGLIDLAGEYCFDFIVHGHKHIPRYQHMVSNALHPINILCAGSFVARLDDRWFDGVGNSFHIIEIDQICENKAIPQGRIRSWSHFVSHGWIENIEGRDHVPHESDFGSSYTRQELSRKLKLIINSLFINKEFILWQEVEKEEPNIKYCSSSVLSLVLKDIKDEVGFTIYREPELGLLKKEVQNG